MIPATGCRDTKARGFQRTGTSGTRTTVFQGKDAGAAHGHAAPCGLRRPSCSVAGASSGACHAVPVPGRATWAARPACAQHGLPDGAPNDERCPATKTLPLGREADQPAAVSCRPPPPAAVCYRASRAGPALPACRRDGMAWAGNSWLPRAVGTAASRAERFCGNPNCSIRTPCSQSGEFCSNVTM